MVERTGEEGVCIFCDGKIENCKCHEAAELLSRLYGYSAVTNELHLKDIREVARQLEAKT